MKKEFIPRTFDEFKNWILSEIGEITIEDLRQIYLKITEQKKSKEKTTTNSKK